jgi:hypothetical protein
MQLFRRQCWYVGSRLERYLNPLNAELNPICHLLALLGGATIVVVSSLRVNVIYIRNVLFSNVVCKHSVSATDPRVMSEIWTLSQSKTICYFTDRNLPAILEKCFWNKLRISLIMWGIRRLFMEYPNIKQMLHLFSHTYGASWYYRSFCYSPTNAQVIVLKTILKFTLK